MKTCSRCKVPKPLTEFHKHPQTRDRHHSQCKKCSNESKSRSSVKHRDKNKKADAEHRQRNQIWVIEYLKNHSCIDCGEPDPVVLEFDHRGDKIRGISTMFSGYTLENIQAEIAKCDVRCANCHKRKTAKEEGWFKLVYMRES